MSWKAGNQPDFTYIFASVVACPFGVSVLARQTELAGFVSLL